MRSSHPIRPVRRALAGVALVAALTAGFAAPAAQAADWSATGLAGFALSASLQQAINNLTVTETPVREMAATFNGGWVIVTDEQVPQVLFGGPVPTSCIARVHQYIQAGREIDVVAFTPGDGWVVIAEDLAWREGPMSFLPELDAAVLGQIALGHRLTELVFDADGNGFSLLSIGGNWALSHGMPSDLVAAIAERHAHDRRIERMQMDPDGNWVLFAGDWFASDGIHPSAFKAIKECQRTERSLDHVLLGPASSFAIISQGAFTPVFSDPIQAIEYGLSGIEPDGSHLSNIWQRMEDLDIAGVSLAVIEDDQLRWSRGYGVLENGTQRWVRTDTPFDSASLSKTVSTMMFLNVVDDPQFPATLDMNVKYAATKGPLVFWNDLLLWAAYGPLFKGAMPFTQITLRRLLSHTAAMVPHGSLKSMPGEATPTTLEILFGMDTVNGEITYGGSKMPCYQEDLFSDGGSWQPGQVWKYSGGGFMVAQAMIEAITNQNFHSLMFNRVLEPLQLEDTTFQQPLEGDWLLRSAVPHDGSGNPLPQDERPFYAWEAAGGMFTSASDLAQCVLTLMNMGTHPQLGESVLGFQSAYNMMQKQTPAGESKLYGLGLEVSEPSVSLFNDAWFRHDGDHGEAAARLAGSPGRGEGLVILINGGDDDAGTLRTEIYEAFKAAYGWN